MKRLVFCLAFVWCAVSFAQTSQTSLRIASDPRDYFGGGRNYLYGSGSTFEVSSRVSSIGLVNGASIKVNRDTPDYWILDFGANNGILRPGFYERAQGFLATGNPSIDITHAYSGCNVAGGTFAVLDAGIDYSTFPPKLDRFAAVFDFQCEAYPYGLTGTLYWNYVPTSELMVSNSVFSAGDTATVTVKLAKPAPTDGVSVELASSVPDLIPSPQKINIPPGESVGQFLMPVIHAPDADSLVRFIAIVNGIASVAEVRVLASSRRITRLELYSDPGDFVGDGKTLTYTLNDGVWSLSAGWNDQYGPPSVTFIGVRFRGLSSFWDLGFDAGSDRAPFPGVFAAAKRFPFNGQSPGLDIGGSDTSPNVGRGCNKLTGFFTVYDVDVDYAYDPPKVNRFAATFEQHCEDNKAALRGKVYYNYEPPGHRRAVGK